MKRNFMDPNNAGDVVEAIKNYVDTHGGDGAQWISYQDYQALTEQEKMNGTAYFVYDWPDSGQ